MSDMREDSDDPRVYDEPDDILVEFSALVLRYTENIQITETESDLLHRWISTKANEYRIGKYLEKISDIQINGNKTIPYKTNARQLVELKKISEASSFLMSHLDFLSQISNLDHALKRAYDKLARPVDNNAGDPSAAGLGWGEFRNHLYHDLGLLMHSANVTYESLEKTGGTRGQPPKTLRDKIFIEWHEMLAANLKLSNDKATHLACDSWPLYFPHEYIGFDAARQVLKAKLASGKGI